ncbi:HET domain-containing protein [Fusarium sp. LHS14.1]|nr:HET domain-containing protein [Fusarium sp. LHS14.1]
MTLPFIAISYVWGSDELTEKITVNGSEACVTNSLYHAVKGVFSHSRDVCPAFPGDRMALWVDGLCINQSDDEEKNVQVSLMSEIYGNAIMVTLYAAKEGIVSDGALQLARKCWEWMDSHIDDDPAEWAPKLADPKSWVELGFPPDGHESYAALRHMFSLPWSRRAWIVQEVSVASEVVIIVGKSTFCWEPLEHLVFGASWGVLREACFYPPEGGEAERIPGRQGSGYVRIQALVRRFSHNDKDEPAMELCELLGVYIDTAARILKNAHGLHLLSSVFPSKAIDLPSWVPDWSSRNFYDGNIVAYASPTRGEGQYQADGHQYAQVRFNDDDTEFTTQGIIFDQIYLILPVDNRGQHNPTYPKVVESSSAAEETFYALIGNVQTILESECERLGVNAYLGKGGMKEALWRTLILNSDKAESQGAGPEYESYYDAQVKLQWVRFLEECGLEECGYNVPGVDEEVIVKAIRFANAMRRTSCHRPIGLTWRGYIGSVPRNSRVNDEVCILRGGRVPFILRRLGQGSRFSFVGDAYVHGIMRREAWEKARDEDKIDITLV